MFVAVERGDEFAGRRVPDAGGVIVGSGRDARGVGRVGERSDFVFVAVESGAEFTGRRVPDAGGVIE